MKRIFLDYQSTTPVDPRVLDKMLPYFTEKFGNPHSAEHIYGIESFNGVENAAGEISGALGVAAKDLVFTSGATEANNLAFRGLLGRAKGHFVSSLTEHKSVTGTLTALEKLGHKTSWVPVDSQGIIDLDALAAAITPKTTLVSIMAVNGEIGVIQPIDAIGAMCRSRGVPLHTDAAQAFGKIDMRGVIPHADFVSLSAHKIYGPKGVGALYIKHELRKRLHPLITGAGQQGGARAGTLPTPLIVGFGAAAILANEGRLEETSRLAGLRKRLLQGLQEAAGPVLVNGSRESRIAGNLNLRFPGVDADSLLMMVPQLALSTGSACSSGALGPSEVLLALGLSQEDASQSVRLGLGRMTTEDEIDEAVRLLVGAIGRLRDS